MEMFNASQTIGDIVSIMPKASEVFKKYNIDFCCGGKRPLAEAIREQKIDERELLGKLNEVYEETKKLTEQVDFRKLPPSELVDYIVNTHHAFAKRTLGELNELMATILRVHGPKHSELFKVHKLLSGLKADLEQHFVKEEEVLFPQIKEYGRKPSQELIDSIRKDIEETESEHEAAGDILKELRKVTSDYTVPEDACGTFIRTYKKLEELESDLFRHIHLENNILFKTIMQRNN